MWTVLSQNAERSFTKVWSELCGMWTLKKIAIHLQSESRLIWTMWDVNKRSWRTSTKAIHVWSELCGMWTGGRRGQGDGKGRVWSELCGMWTRLAWYNNIMDEFVWSELCGMWTRDAVRNCDCVVCVWSELCGMWTFFNLTSEPSRYLGLIWTMWDVNTTGLQEEG